MSNYIKSVTRRQTSDWQMSRNWWLLQQLLAASVKYIITAHVLASS